MDRRSDEPTDLNVVLINPEIPGNAGNVGRTCVGLGATLHLVGTLGFSLDEKYLRRAGLDYWPKVRLARHASWEAFIAALPPSAGLTFFSARAAASFWDRRVERPAYLIFGSESRGFPPSFAARYADHFFRIPVSDEIRSLNLATAVGVAAFEVARQWRQKLA